MNDVFTWYLVDFEIFVWIGGVKGYDVGAVNKPGEGSGDEKREGDC